MRTLNLTASFCLYFPSSTRLSFVTSIAVISGMIVITERLLFSSLSSDLNRLYERDDGPRQEEHRIRWLVSSVVLWFCYLMLLTLVLQLDRRWRYRTVRR